MYDYNAAFYSFFAEPSASLSPKASMVLRFLKDDLGAAVLDVGSGPGDVAFELAHAGVSVTCVEPSSAMRSVFLSRLIDRRDLDSRLTLLAGSAMTLELDARYRVACAFSVLFLLKHPEEQWAALRRLGDHLTDDGVLIANFLLDSPVAEIPRQLKGERTLGETTYRHFSAKSLRDGRATVEWTFETWYRGRLVDSTTELFPLLTNSYTACRSLVDEAGLDIAAEFSGFDGAAFDPERSKSLGVALTRRNSKR